MCLMRVLHIELGQRDVVVHIHAADGPVRPVFKLEQVRVVHCNSEAGRSHQDLHLEAPSWSEREASRQLALFTAPLLPNLAVPHNHLLPALVKARVKVEYDVLARVEVNDELVGVVFDSSSDGDELVLQSVRTLVIERHRQVCLRSHRASRP